jgi:hypothetical protein
MDPIRAANSKEPETDSTRGALVRQQASGRCNRSQYLLADSAAPVTCNSRGRHTPIADLGKRLRIGSCVLTDARNIVWTTVRIELRIEVSDDRQMLDCTFAESNGDFPRRGPLDTPSVGRAAQ